MRLIQMLGLVAVANCAIFFYSSIQHRRPSGSNVSPICGCLLYGDDSVTNVQFGSYFTAGLAFLAHAPRPVAAVYGCGSEYHSGLALTVESSRLSCNAFQVDYLANGTLNGTTMIARSDIDGTWAVDWVRLPRLHPHSETCVAMGQACPFSEMNAWSSDTKVATPLPTPHHVHSRRSPSRRELRAVDGLAICLQTLQTACCEDLALVDARSCQRCRLCVLAGFWWLDFVLEQESLHGGSSVSKTMHLDMLVESIELCVGDRIVILSACSLDRQFDGNSSFGNLRRRIHAHLTRPPWEKLQRIASPELGIHACFFKTLMPHAATSHIDDECFFDTLAFLRGDVNASPGLKK